MLADVYDQFITVVAEERKLDRRIVLRYADGRVFTGRQALEWGFVDTLGTYEDAISIAGDLGGIDGTPRVVKEEERRSFWDMLLGGTAADLAGLRDELFRQPVIQYRLSLPF